MDQQLVTCPDAVELEREHPDADLIGPVNAPSARDMPFIEGARDELGVPFAQFSNVPEEKHPKDTPAEVKEQPSHAVTNEDQPDNTEQPAAVPVEEPESEQSERESPLENQPRSIDEESISSASLPSSINSSEEDDIPLIHFYRPGVNINDPRGVSVIYVPGIYPEEVGPAPQQRGRPRLIPPRRPRSLSLSEDSSSSPEIPAAVRIRRRRRRIDGQR